MPAATRRYFARSYWPASKLCKANIPLLGVAADVGNQRWRYQLPELLIGMCSRSSFGEVFGIIGAAAHYRRQSMPSELQFNPTFFTVGLPCCRFREWASARGDFPARFRTVELSGISKATSAAYIFAKSASAGERECRIWLPSSRPVGMRRNGAARSSERLPLDDAGGRCCGKRRRQGASGRMHAADVAGGRTTRSRKAAGGGTMSAISGGCSARRSARPPSFHRPSPGAGAVSNSLAGARQGAGRLASDGGLMLNGSSG